MHAWLNTIPIGGEEERRYDPSELLEFAWAQGLEEERPETLYMLFVEHQHTQGLLKAERMEQEMRMSVHDSLASRLSSAVDVTHNISLSLIIACLVYRRSRLDSRSLAAGCGVRECRSRA